MTFTNQVIRHKLISAYANGGVTGVIVVYNALEGDDMEAARDWLSAWYDATWQGEVLKRIEAE